MSVVQIPFRWWYNRFVASDSSFSFSWQFKYFQFHILLFPGPVLKTYVKTDPGSVYLPPAQLSKTTDAARGSWLKFRFPVKSPFPSGCRLTAHLAQPPPCHQVDRLVSGVIFWLVAFFGVGGAIGVALSIVISQSAVLYALHSDPRISWRQQ